MMNVKDILFVTNMLFDFFKQKNDSHPPVMHRYLFANDNTIKSILAHMAQPQLVHRMLAYQDKQELALSCGALLFGRSLARVVMKSDVQRIRDILGSQRRDWAIKQATTLGLSPHPLPDTLTEEIFCQYGYALMMQACHEQVPFLQDMLRYVLGYNDDIILQKNQSSAAAAIVAAGLFLHDSESERQEA